MLAASTHGAPTPQTRYRLHVPKLDFIGQRIRSPRALTSDSWSEKRLPFFVAWDSYRLSTSLTVSSNPLDRLTLGSSLTMALKRGLARVAIRLRLPPLQITPHLSVLQLSH